MKTQIKMGMFLQVTFILHVIIERLFLKRKPIHVPELNLKKLYAAFDEIEDKRKARSLNSELWFFISVLGLIFFMITDKS